MATKPVAFKPPKAPAAAADMWYTTRAERLGLDRQSNALKAKEAILKDYLIDTIPLSQATGVSGKLVTVMIEQDEYVEVEDWDKLYAYIKKNNAFDLLNRAVNSAAVKERLGKKVKIPGIRMQGYKKISYTTKVGSVGGGSGK